MRSLKRRDTMRVQFAEHLLNLKQVIREVFPAELPPCTKNF